MPARLDIAIQRNEDYAASWNIADNAGLPIDVSDWTFALDVKERLGVTYVLQAATVEITDGPAGQIDILLQGGPPSALAGYGDPLLAYSLPYDLLATDSDGVRTALVSGYVILSRRISS